MEARKLDPEFKTKWCAALRSGEYKQGKGQLHQPLDNTYCCLGVACHISGNMIPKGFYFIPDYPVDGYSQDKVPAILRGAEGFPGKLAQMNDGAGDWYGKPKSFLEIADYIEANL